MSETSTGREPNGRFIEGCKGGPGRRFGACMVRPDRPLTAPEKQARHTAKIGRAAAYAYKRKWEKANPEKHRASKRRTMLKKYGLTPELFDEMFLAQGERCAICRSDEPFTPKGWQVDHCHKTGKVRGILCTHCNRMLAGAVDNPQHLRQGVEYLNRIDATRP